MIIVVTISLIQTKHLNIKFKWVIKGLRQVKMNFDSKKFLISTLTALALESPVLAAPKNKPTRLTEVGYDETPVTIA